jgi:hypothetical protein
MNPNIIYDKEHARIKSRDWGKIHLTDDVRPMTPRQLVVFFIMAPLVIAVCVIGSAVAS